MSRFSFLLLLLGLGLALSCGSPSQSQQLPHQKIVRVNLGEEPQTLDPRKARQLSSISLVRMLFEGLVRIGKEAEVELALAESVDVSSDLKRYTFHLRVARWTNGDPVTASDFVYAWKKVLDPNYPSDTAFQLYGIKNGKKAREG